MRWPWRRAGQADRAQAGGQQQGHGAADGQGDPGGGLPRPARRGGGDDTEEAGGEELARRRRAWQKEREEGRWPATFCLGE